LAEPGIKPMAVPGGQLFFARLMRATAGFWERLGNLESRVLRSETERVRIEKPIYVTGLARSGTTILTELLAAHPDVTSLRYSDFPPAWTPYWWNALRAQLPLPKVAPAERSHRDRLRVTPESPEAVEEVLWMHFFPGAHEPGAVHVLDESSENSRFERFYRQHLRKLLAVRKSSRYLAKGNYNLTRLAYLRKLFPDARFVVPLREPEWHIASLMKQDRLFRGQHELNPKVTRYMQLLGHFEFGVHKHPINVGDAGLAAEIARLWDSDEAVRGWALYWQALHEFLLKQLESDPELARACLLVPYEPLCGETEPWIERILEHAGLPAETFGEARAEFATRLSLPDYYRPDFDDRERHIIEGLTGDIHRRLRALAEAED